MHLTRPKITRRSQTRIPGVLPVRVRGKEASGAQFEALVHTLDLTPTGVRLGAVRRELKALDTLVVLFRKRRIEFTVMWTKLMVEPAADKNDAPGEYQVGLQMVAQESDPWGLGVPHSNTPLAARAAAILSAA
ncbi:MAG: hypothetical protein ABSH02_06855 [Candidatus Sulfotelmatobacter sp.]|jgi:hypothetical protein